MYKIIKLIIYRFRTSPWSLWVIHIDRWPDPYFQRRRPLGMPHPRTIWNTSSYLETIQSNHTCHRSNTVLCKLLDQGENKCIIDSLLDHWCNRLYSLQELSKLSIHHLKIKINRSSESVHRANIFLHLSMFGYSPFTFSVLTPQMLVKMLRVFYINRLILKKKSLWLFLYVSNSCV